MKTDRVLIIGAGGLGVPAALSLARHRVRRIGVMDPDPVELSNLARQVIYRDRDIGAPKVVAMARGLREMFADIEVESYPFALESENAASIIANFGFVIDATDDPATKFLINDVCVSDRIPFVYAGVIGMTGQLMTVLPGSSACLRCLFEAPPDQSEAASCRDAGIIGPVAGAIGALQGMEAARWLNREPLSFVGAIFTYDATNGVKTRVMPINPRFRCGCEAAQNANHREQSRVQ